MASHIDIVEYMYIIVVVVVVVEERRCFLFLAGKVPPALPNCGVSSEEKTLSVTTTALTRHSHFPLKPAGTGQVGQQGWRWGGWWWCYITAVNVNVKVSQATQLAGESAVR